MPFVSSAQQRWGHTPEGQKALGGKKKVAEWDAATDYNNIPEKVSPNTKKKQKSGMHSGLGIQKQNSVWERQNN